MNLFELFVKIGADTSQAEKGMKNTQKNSETLTNKIKVMSAQFEAAQKNVDELTKKFNESVQKTGATSKETQELADKLNKAEKEADDAKKALDKYNDELNETEEKTEKAHGGLSKFIDGLGKGLATAAKIGGAALLAAGTGITALTTAAAKKYAEYEQLVGGAELMFGKAFDTVKKNAQEAYKTVQMSQNEYLQQVNGFATGLKTALGGNEKAAADLSHKIIKAEADIIAATGNAAENVQNAFNGIMKSNFTMLDNLQIGITPTKEGFQEVIDKVNEWNKANGEATNYQMGNLADMQSALVDYIDMVGMSGYAQREASKTISGSLASMKAAWGNLITGIADDNADFDVLINNMVESVGAFGENILPRIEVALDGAVKLIEGLFPKIIEALPNLINTLLPSIVNGALNIVQSFVTAISDNGDLLVQSAIDAVMTLANGILNMLPEIIKLGLDLIVSLALGIAEALPELVPTIIDVVLQIVDTLTNPETLSNLLNAALVLVMALMEGFLNPDSIEKVYNAIFDLVDNIIDFLLDEENLSKIITAAYQIVIALGMGMLKQRIELAKTVIKLIGAVVESIFTTNWFEIGKDVVKGVLKGLKDAWKDLKKWFTDAWDNLVGGVKDLLGIHSPSRVFAGIGKNMALGVGEGWEDTFGDIQDDIDSSLDFGEADYGITTSTTSIGDFGGSSTYGYGGSQNVNVTVGIDDSANAMGLARALLPFLKIAEKEVYA